MENSTSLPHSSDPPNQTLDQNSTIHVNQITQKNFMTNFQQFIFVLAETHPNKPLTPATKTLLDGRLNRFDSEYKTPDHPPYSAMIQWALQELNEKRGSNEEFISQYLEKGYDNLPWAHSELLKHHLEKLCESGEIVVTRGKRYALPGCLNSSAVVGKRKLPRRKWRYGWERERKRRLKRKLAKKRDQKIRGKDEVAKNNRECDDKEEEQRLTESGAHSEDKSDLTKRLLSCVDENEYSEETGPSEANIRAECNRRKSLSSPLEPCKNTESYSVTKNLRPRPAKTEVAHTNELQHSVPRSRRLRVLFRQKPDAADVNLGRELRVLCETKTRCSCFEEFRTVG